MVRAGGLAGDGGAGDLAWMFSKLAGGLVAGVSGGELLISKLSQWKFHWTTGESSVLVCRKRRIQLFSTG